MYFGEIFRIHLQDKKVAVNINITVFWDGFRVALQNPVNLQGTKVAVDIQITVLLDTDRIANVVRKQSSIAVCVSVAADTYLSRCYQAMGARGSVVC
jgi:hypothetical protein